jgi:acetyltransferase
VTKTILARSANEAMMIATQLGFPVALKIDSPDISHKSDVQGVALNVMNAAPSRARHLQRHGAAVARCSRRRASTA